MVKIRLSLYGLPVGNRLDDGMVMEAHEGASVRDLLRLFDLKEEEIGLVVVNGKSVTLGQPLMEGDRVTLIAPLAGG
jgi:sulfur carrier protein ThiS